MPSKRHRSPSPPGRHGAVNVFPPPDAASSLQRLQNGLDASAIIRHTISDLFPYQELLMRILSFLTPTELALMQGVSKYWAKMSLDPQVSITLSLVYFCPLADLVSGVLNNLDWWYSQLWKRLYLCKLYINAVIFRQLMDAVARYPHPHHSRLIYKSQASSTPSRSLRPIARLPSRAFPPPSPTRSASATPIAHPAPSPAGPGPDPPRLLQGIGRARPLATDSSIPTGEVGYGVRNDGVDWKMMFRLGTNWLVVGCSTDQSC
jgi:hypothetical protein